MRHPRHLLPRLVPVLLFALAAACTASDDDDQNPQPFELMATPHGVASSTPLLSDRDLLAYFASEATTGPGGTDLNGDGDTLDSVPVVVDTDTGTRRPSQVAARRAEFLNGTLLLEVVESDDGRDWNMDLDMSDVVLLAYRLGPALPDLVAELSPTTVPATRSAGSKMFLAGPVAPSIEFDTNLSFVTVSPRSTLPAAPTAVISTIDDALDDGVSFALVAADGDVLFLTADETVDGDLNGDGDALDTSVLAVADANEAGPTVTGVGVALSAPGSVDAEAQGTDWLVAFLVDEAAEGANLNDATLFSAAWQPLACSGREDVDQLDHVLHWFLLDDLIAAGPVVNTGLVGSVGARVVAHPRGFVAVVSSESEEGNAGCDLNGDGDFVDPIFRWVAASDPMAPVLPVTDAARLLAVDAALSGGAGGFVTTNNLFVLAVDEAADGRSYDGQPGTDRTLLAAHTPATGGQSWNFSHGSGSIPIAVTWVAEDQRSSSRFLAAITEEAPGGADRNGDGDTLDSVPTFPSALSSNILGFPGVGIAVDASNAGIVTASGYAFYRVSEPADGGRDRNGDGDSNDRVLQRVKLDGSLAPRFMGSLNNLALPSLGAGLDGQDVGAFLYQESQFGPTGNDLNGDGDTNDLVTRWFVLP